MSSRLCHVCKIDEIRPHPNADKLELAIVRGYQCCVRKGIYKQGDRIIYVESDICLPFSLVDQLGVTNYCSKTRFGYRVSQKKLRGSPSFGLIFDLEYVTLFTNMLEDGQDVSSLIGAVKYEPPFKTLGSEMEPSHPLFNNYTSVENLRHYPTLLEKGEMVAVTSKIHGCNQKIGVIDGVVMAGSHKTQRKRPDSDEKILKDPFWFPYSLEQVRNLLGFLSETHKQVILYSEVYGDKIQSLDYGHKNCFGVAAFDLLIDGRYLNHQEFRDLTNKFHVPTVPLINVVEFNGIDQIKNMIPNKSRLGGDHIEEGVVVKPVIERTDPRINRVILKMISDTYILSSHKEKETRDE